MSELETLQSWIDQSHNIVFFGGAGVSTESGIKDFRSPDGLYNQHYKFPPETMLSRSFFDAHPEEFFRFYRDKMLNPGAKPNAAHKKLAELEAAGRAAVLVPSPNVAENHQYYNALELEKQDAAVVIEEKDLSGRKLIETVSGLLAEPGKLERMGQNARTLSVDDSLDRITSRLMNLVRQP